MGVSLTVERDTLGPLGNVLGKGAEAVVHELPDFRLPDAHSPLVYKEYRVARPARYDLLQTVHARLDLTSASRDRLDAMAAWPCRVVTDQDATVGIVMPRIPGSFFDEIVLLGGGGTESSLREIQNLFIPEALAKRIGRPVLQLPERLAVCRDFAAALSFLHNEMRVVFGDINPRNAVYRLREAPLVMFLDCDGVRPLGTVATAPQLNAPDWVPPEGGALSLSSDLYKLGLFILRCLAPGAGASILYDPTLANGLDDVGRDMLRAALTADPRTRPTARAWHVHLSRLTGEPIEPPKVLDVGLDREFTIAGHPVELRWSIQDALTVEVLADNRRFTLDGRPGRGSFPLVVDRTSYVQVRAVNEAGMDNRVLGPIAVVDLPVTHQVPVGMPRMSTTWPNTPDYVLPTPPSLRTPVFVGAPTDPPPIPTGLWSCPLDVVSMLSGPFLTDLISDGEGSR
jgi:hypothetical protein